MRTCHQNTGIEPNKYFYIQQIRCQAGQTALGRASEKPKEAEMVVKKKVSRKRVSGSRSQVSGLTKNFADEAHLSVRPEPKT
jgi:hypothetical protein